MLHYHQFALIHTLSFFVFLFLCSPLISQIYLLPTSLPFSGVSSSLSDLQNHKLSPVKRATGENVTVHWKQQTTVECQFIAIVVRGKAGGGGDGGGVGGQLRGGVEDDRRDSCPLCVFKDMAFLMIILILPRTSQQTDWLITLVQSFSH